MTDLITARGLHVEARREFVLTEVLSGNGHVEDLSRRLNVSEATIRRDLRYLSATGRVTRTYGGAVVGPRAVELDLRQKELTQRQEKEAIAAFAASLVKPGEVLLLDAGTTVGQLAAAVSGLDGLTVFTNGVSALTVLSEADNVDVVVLGGRLRHINQALVGPITEQMLRHVTADKAFLGADGVVGDKGLCCPTLGQTSLKVRMAERAREVYVLADHTKLGREAFPYWAPMPVPYTVITDRSATPEQLGSLRGYANVSCIVADPEANV